MSSGKPAPTSRHARREAERRAAREPRASPARRPFPIIWLTGGALAAGLVLVVILFLATRPAQGLTLVPPGDPAPVGIADGRSLGSAGAPVTLDVYEDFQCPACALYSRATEPRLIREYVTGGRLRIVFHDFSFIGQESLAAATAARAAGAQDAFWPYHDWLFANQNGENRGGFRRDVLVEIARRVGLDVARFERDLNDPANAAAVRAETASASSVPVSSTPTLVVNGKVIESGVWGTIAAAIDAALPPAPSAPVSP
jgi:protein-disulfide isomerase